MFKIFRFRPLILAALVAAVSIGCSGSVAMNTDPLTDEQKQKIKEEDRRVDDEEKSGSGTASPVKRR